MPMRKLKPTTNGLRHSTVPDFAEITKSKPEWKLTEAVRKNGGRNNQGRMTVRHRGGGHRQRYRIIDFKRNKLDVPATVSAIEYDPNRNCRIALVTYADGEKRYILAAKGLEVGATIVAASASTEPVIGSSMLLVNIPQGLVGAQHRNANR